MGGYRAKGGLAPVPVGKQGWEPLSWPSAKPGASLLQPGGRGGRAPPGQEGPGGDQPLRARAEAHDARRGTWGFVRDPRIEMGVGGSHCLQKVRLTEVQRTCIKTPLEGTVG